MSRAAPHHRRPIVLAALVGGIAVSVSARQQTLTAADVDAAIEWGDSGSAAPYLLHHAQTAGTNNDVVVGVVYTPFVRIALVAKAARNGGRQLTAADVPPSLMEPLVYIAFRWYCCDGDHGDSLSAYHPLTPFDYRIAVPGENGPTADGVTSIPVWVRRDLSVLDTFGGPAYPDIVLVAAYPISALSHPSDFVIYRPVHNPNGHAGTLLERGRVTAIDLRLWR